MIVACCLHFQYSHDYLGVASAQDRPHYPHVYTNAQKSTYVPPYLVEKVKRSTFNKNPNAAPAKESAKTPDEPKKYIALTFDDGPSEVTPAILNTLEKYDAVATFFLVGNRIKKYEYSVKRAAKLGCELANHSWSHADLSKLPLDKAKEEISSVCEKVSDLTGETIVSVRPPYGKGSDKLYEMMGDMDLSVIYWSVDPYDWKTRDADKVYDAIMQDVFDGAIIICHDLYEPTAKAMERLIPDLIADGYQFVTVSQLLGESDEGMLPGEVYRRKK